MTPAIMSRFDLFFVVVDECNPTTDFNIARHITTLHQLKVPTLEGSGAQYRFSTEQLRTYIRFARSIKPAISKEAQDLLVRTYQVRFRQF